MKAHRHLLAALAASAFATAGLVLVQPAEAAPESGCMRGKDTVQKLMACVRLREVLEHQKAFQAIADANGGTRAAGTTGYDESLAYIEERMEDAGYEVSRQPFQFFAYKELGPSALQQISPNPATYVEDVDFAPTSQSEPGDITANVTPVDLALAQPGTSTSGCQALDWTGFPAGTIALIQRGGCTFEIKGENAAAAGAVGILFFNQGDTADPSRQGIPAVTLGNGYTGGIPALNLTYPLGVQLANTPNLRMRLFANVERVESTTNNLIAESPGGDADNVVMAGAHLDSVPEGPGINDNGSGSNALLEVAEQMAGVDTENKVRFAWWSAEEASLVGSNYYVSQLSAAELADLEMYLNFDMVASPNYGLFRYDGDGSSFELEGPDGSDDIEALFEQFYERRGVPSEASPFNGRSDYQAFILNGVPAGGLFTGAEGIKTEAQEAKWGGTAGIAYDPCYHQACDTIDNLSHEALSINSDAIAYVLFLYATGAEVLTTGED